MKHKKGQGAGGMNPMMMMGLLLILVLVFMLCEEQNKKKKLEDENKKLKEEIDKLKQQPPPQPPTITPPKNECTENKGVVCDTETGKICDGKELPYDAGSNKLCCEKCKTGPTAPAPVAPVYTGGYLLAYVGGDDTKTCAFQKGANCGIDKYCENDQWLKAKDTKTCCKSTCIARIQHKDVDFGSPLGKTTVERFSGNRFGIWYGSGVGEGFVEIGKPNYVEAKSTSTEKYEFNVGSKKYSFSVVVNDPSRIEVSPVGIGPSVQIADLDSCTSDSDCISVKADCCGCNQGGKAKAINKGKYVIYETSLQCNDDINNKIFCAQVISGDPSCSAVPKCVSNKCTLSPSTGPTIMEVSIVNGQYNPTTVSIKAGTNVKWTNNDNIAHTVTSNTFDSTTLQPGQSFSQTFSDAGEVSYHCTLHPVTMTGKIAVT